MPQPEKQIIEIANEKVIDNFNYDKKVMAEEVMHKNPGAKILPTQPVPDVLPSIEFMVEILHKKCGEIAFYYTHVPAKSEMMTAVRSRTVDGDKIVPGCPMICGSCGEHVGPKGLQVRRRDMEAANHG